MGPQRFRAAIAADPQGRAVITVPFDPDEMWGAKANHPVRGTIDGRRFRAAADGCCPSGCATAPRSAMT
jgi:hypothetical protein